MQENQERFYKITTLNFLFAMAALTLLLALVLMLSYDYSRGWKKYQRDFRELEIEKTRVKYDLEMSRVKSQPQYEELSQKITALNKDLTQRSADIKKLEEESSKTQSQYDIVNQQSQFAKAEYDAKRYKYEEKASHKDSKSQELEKDLEKLDKKIQELRISLEEYQSKQDEIQNKIVEKTAQVKSLQKDLKSLNKQLDIYGRKLEKIDWEKMTFSNKLGSLIRDLPIIELANPSYRVQQIVLQDITDSVIFMNVPKVDRCTTCHLGIANPDYKDAPQPFTTHPNLELYLDNNSPHPLEEFGCTTCHQGRGRGTSFLSAVHTPSAEKQKEEWIKKYNWHVDHHWEYPMYQTQYVQASCFKCHSGQTVIKGAEKLNLGLNLIERAGCYSCHTITKYKDWPKTGPDLTRIASKTSKDWVYRWIADPHAFRHNTWMPAFLNQSNNSDPESQVRTQQELHAMVYYLFNKSVSFSMESMPTTANAKRGEELVSSLGCLACHHIQPNPTQEETNRQELLREQGPNLIGMGSKASKDWIYTWLKDPNRYHPETKMPNLRLSDGEAADITAFLTSQKDNNFMKNPISKIDEKILSAINAEFLKKSKSMIETQNQLATMSLNDKLMYAGEKLIRYYGCYSCHNITGFEKDKPIGTDLTEQGSKDAARLDFGFIHMEHSKEAWIKQKLKDPRIFDQNLVKEPYDKLKMPNFQFTDQEAEAITTALLGFLKDRPSPEKMKAQTPQNRAIEEGQKLIRQFNCQGCHLIENEGGAIQPAITNWLVQFKNYPENDAKAVTVSFSPPNLVGEGKKVQTQWLFEFLHRPEVIRPWLSVRMPTYHFDTAQLNTFLKYFNALDHEEFPFSDTGVEPMKPEDYVAAEKLFSMDYFGCAKCHIVGSKLPEGSPDSWAPNFALAKRRLKPNWIIEWLNNPQALLPGTKMPTYFDPQNFSASGPEDILNGDEEIQIKVLRDYLLTITNSSGTEAKDDSSLPMTTPVPTVPQESSKKETSSPKNPQNQNAVATDDSKDLVK